MAKKGELGVLVMCADWRLHRSALNMNERVSTMLGTRGMDVLSVPGPDGSCMPERIASELPLITRWLSVLVEAHEPSVLAFLSHERCAGHPVEDAAHREDICRLMHECKDELSFSGSVVALVASYTSDTEWSIEEVARV